MAMKRAKFLIAAPLALVAACSQPRGIRPGDTQVVAQWITSDLPASRGSTAAALIRGISSAFARISLENRVDRACRDNCFLDGNDIGSGTYNLYLYTGDVAATVKVLVELERANRLPAGLRIGGAKYTDAEHRNWTYEPV